MKGMQTAVLATIWTEFVVATLLMCTRTISGALTKRRYQSDFWLGCLTYALALTTNIFNVGSSMYQMSASIQDLTRLIQTISVHYGAGRHQDHLSVSRMVDAIHWQWITFQTYVIAHMFAKLAIIAFLVEIEPEIPRCRKILLGIVAFINVGVNMGTSSLQWQQCKPVEATWDPRVAGVCNGRHRNQLGGYVQGSVGAAVDVFLVLYPVCVFWNLNLDRRVRLGLCTLFGVGLLCAACAVLKTISISTLTASDATYQLAVCDIYSLTEMWVALIVGCVPTSKKIFRVVWRRYRRESHDAESNRYDLTPGSGNTSYAGGPRRGSNYRAQSKDAAAASEESILDEADKAESPTTGTTHGIVLTRTVQVEADTEEEGDEGGDARSSASWTRDKTLHESLSRESLR